jgi:DNA polymerase-1
MQGSAADIIKIAMIDVHNWLQEEDVAARIIMQVHDELVFEVKSEIAEETKNKIIQIMESAVNLEVPLIVDAAIGANWEEAH